MIPRPEPHDDAVAMAAREDHDLARRVAVAAGRALVELRDRDGLGAMAGGELRAEADRVANEVILDLLEDRIAAGDGLLSEEHPDSDARLMRDRVWIVDPLDGTREFAEPGRRDWAVHVGLAIDHVAVAGAVALPAQGTVEWTGRPPGLARRRPASLRLAVSRSRPPDEAGRLERRLGCQLVPMGSAGAKTMAVIHGEVDAYVHAGGQYEWDSCAPVAVATAAGLHASRLDGSPLRYNQPNPYLPDLLICRPELATPILEALSVP